MFKYLSLVALTLLYGGCSYKTSEFIEDLFAENRVVKAEGQYKGKIKADAHTPILSSKSNEIKNVKNKRIHSYRGKIAAVHFDRDFNLYVYTFIDHVTRKPITFYYDKNIHHNKYKGDYRVVISGNYLVKYDQLDPIVKFKEVSDTEQSTTTQKDTTIKYKKRKRSSIKVPEEEKINPL